MKEEYRQPTVKVLIIKPRSSILAYSYGDDIDGTGIDNTPGSQEDVLEAYMTAWKLLKLEDLDMVYRSNAIITRAKKLEKKFELLEEKEQRRLMRPHYNKPK